MSTKIGWHSFALLIRRVGGLMMQQYRTLKMPTLIRRVGGLMNTGTAYAKGPQLIRRVGGLMMPNIFEISEW